MILLVTGVANWVGSWCGGIMAGGGVGRRGGGKEGDGDDGVCENAGVVDVGGAGWEEH